MSDVEMTDSAAPTEHTSPYSGSATLHSHEPFETFQHKIAALSADLHDSSIDDIRQIKDGLGCRMIAASVTWPPTSDSSTEVKKDVIFSMPGHSGKIWLDQDIQDLAATQHFVRQQGIPSAEVLAFDTTANNSISSPYMVTSFIKGTRLDLIYEQMSLTEKFEIADQLVSVLVKIEGVEFSRSGDLNRIEEIEYLGPWCAHDGVSNTEGWDIQVSDMLLQPWGQPAQDPPKLISAGDGSALDLVKQRLSAWHEVVADDSFRRESSHRLQKIFDEFESNQHFRQHHIPTNHVLHHYDLEPQDILVERASDEVGWRIQGILRWNNAYSAPIVLTRQPPIWLWDRTAAAWKKDNSDADALPASHYDSLTGEAKSVKERFETAYVELLMPTAGRTEYIDQAYGTGSWLRRMWCLAMHGFYDPSHDEEMNKLEEDWARDVLNVQ